MTHAAGMNTNAPPLAWSRAACFGIVAGGFGVLGHDIVTGCATQAPVLAGAVAFATLVARPLAPLRIGRGTMLAGIVVLQLSVHLACLVVIDAPVVHLHGFAPTSVLVGGLAMLGVHGVSIVLGAAILLALESYAWSRIVHAARWITAAPRAPRSHDRSFVLVRADRSCAFVQRERADARMARGPPMPVPLPRMRHSIY